MPTDKASAPPLEQFARTNPGHVASWHARLRPGEVQYYLFRSIDRFTRGGASIYDRMKSELTRRGVAMVDSLGMIRPMVNTLEDLGVVFDWSLTSPSEVSEVVSATTSKQEVTTILTRLIGQSIRVRRSGYKVRQAVDGFVNVRTAVDGRKRVIEQPDPERAKYFVELFALRASGQYSDPEICERVNAMGYRSKITNVWDASHRTIIAKKGGKPLIVKRLQEIVARPIYCGVICEKWTRGKPIKARYPGLVSIETFNAANRGAVFIRANEDDTLEVLYDHHPDRNVRRYTKNSPLFPFRRVVVCPLCRHPFYGSSPRGSTGRGFPTYHCTRSHKYFGVEKAAFDSAVVQFVERLRFTPETLVALEPEIIDCYRAAEVELTESVADIARHATALEFKKTEAIQAFKVATSDIVRRSLEAEAEEYDRQAKAARGTHVQMAIGEDDLREYLRDVERVLELPSIILKDPANPREQEALFSLVFGALPSWAEIAFGTAKLDWIFYLSSDSETPESARVRKRGLDWNSIEQSVLRWKKLQSLLDPSQQRGSTTDIPAIKSPKSPSP